VGFLLAHALALGSAPRIYDENVRACIRKKYVILPVWFFRPRWHGQIPLAVLLWRDTVCVGTLINLVASFLALAALALGAHTGLAVALHFAPMPYNIFLLAAVLRLQADNTCTTIIAVAWFLVMLVI